MDEFLSELYVEYFKKWILLQTSKDYKLYFNDNDSNIILIEAENSLSRFLNFVFKNEYKILIYCHYYS